MSSVISNQFNTDKMICEVDQKFCDPIQSVSNKLSKYISNSNTLNNTLKAISKDLPCPHCKKVIQTQVDSLSNVRLGKHERRILLLAPPPGGDYEVIEPPEGGIRINESHLKAIRKLTKIGLITRKRTKQRRLAVLLTPMGNAISKRLNKELKKRNPIRWAKFKDDIISIAPLSPDKLLNKFERFIRYDQLLEQLCSNGNSNNSQFMNSFPDMIFQINHEGIFLDFKPSPETTPFASPDEFLGKKISEILPPDVAKLSLDVIQKALSSGETQSYNYSLPYNGSSHDYEGKVISIDSDKVICFVRDITKRNQIDEAIKESHEKFLKILDNLDAIVYVSDMETYEILYINNTMKESIGDVAGQACWKSIQQGQSGPCSFCTNDKILNKDGQPGDVYTWEFKNTVNNRWYEIRDRAIKWIDERIVRLEIAIDITERKVAEESALQSN